MTDLFLRAMGQPDPTNQVVRERLELIELAKRIQNVEADARKLLEEAEKRVRMQQDMLVEAAKRMASGIPKR